MHARHGGGDGAPFSEELDESASHVIRARTGNEESLTWLVLHFSPLLQAQAQYRLRGSLAHACDPDDLVDETWAVVLPKLGELHGEPHRLGHVLLKFLSHTLLHKILALRQRQQRRPGRQVALRPPESSLASPLDGLTGKSGPASGILRDREAQEALHHAIDSLNVKDREVVVLRGLEQRSNDEVASFLGMTPAGATQRYQRALERLRRRLPGSAFDWLWSE